MENNQEAFLLHQQLAADCIELIDLPLCKVLLMNDSQYPWFILVPRVADVRELYQLSWDDQQQVMNESSLLSELLMQTFKGEKLNVAALGNVVPQLHIHHIIRYQSDIAWPKPIWGVKQPVPYEDKALAELKEQVLPLLTAILK